MKYSVEVFFSAGQPLGSRGAILWAPSHSIQLEVEAKNRSEAEDIAKEAVLTELEPKNVKRIISNVVVKPLN